jgi:FtsH-binding integral membrane protein
MGLSLSTIFLVYTRESIAVTFFATAGAFAGLSLFGYTTKRDLTGVGSFLIMGLWGIIIASVVNMFVHSGPMGFVISVAGVLIFAGLTAYDTQRLKMMYYQLGGDEARTAVATNYGALNLYLNFINLFQLLLSLLGNRR